MSVLCTWDANYTISSFVVFMRCGTDLKWAASALAKPEDTGIHIEE
jgi:hypothetical protein